MAPQTICSPSEGPGAFATAVPGDGKVQQILIYVGKETWVTGHSLMILRKHSVEELFLLVGVCKVDRAKFCRCNIFFRPEMLCITHTCSSINSI